MNDLTKLVLIGAAVIGIGTTANYRLLKATEELQESSAMVCRELVRSQLNLAINENYEAFDLRIEDTPAFATVARQALYDTMGYEFDGSFPIGALGLEKCDEVSDRLDTTLGRAYYASRLAALLEKK